ncbi:response regulator transcription factor [Marinobacterium sediminicola]|uniref:DNA-binding response regulator, OmpR family, contains REC and winged-helix (WHTH) domain n=1 Tax=Marinobacterium sediminicola TaxID=518898 RepID=A0ABY1S4Y2_9GAMM|nr:response regulator transcription factor [Marinobacterium sediminicola]ULG68958.1 response regulator transcription factor [Marinobacterium sediminicola]SMR78460.1 DNA-binding response regulator, OmpR family, contains REC and winged-helix (wHTH) domain [Marinobacterium sediminicola]
MKILIAEDDLNIRLGLKDLLEAEGYECLEAADGEQAWSLYREQIAEQAAPALVLLDIMMPKLDGYALCRRIRQQDQQLPVIFITAKSEEIDQVLGLELGADDYIKKPFGSREVIARIRAVTRRCLTQRASAQEAASFHMADLQVFPDQLRAERAGQKIDLSLRDLRILQHLHRNRGRVLSRDELFDAGWGREYLPSSRTLDQHISKLRKAVEQDAQAPQIIVTVHGVGYRFDG